MANAPLGLVAFVTILGLAVHAVAGLLAGRVDHIAAYAGIALFASIFPLIYAARVCYRHGYEAGISTTEVQDKRNAAS